MRPRVIVTRTVHDWAEHEPSRVAWLTACLRRHVAGDWGDVEGDDWAANDAAVRHRCGRVPSAYGMPAELAAATGQARVWIITDDVEDPDTATTVLWPSDYVHDPLERGPCHRAGASLRSTG
jgi:hypothetical protein